MLGAIWEAFVERYRAALDPVTLEAGPQVAALAPQLLASGSSPRTPVHSDYRLDNMLFAAGGADRPLTVVDWQTVQLGVGPSDVAYFLGSAFEPELRRSCERDLLVRYHRALVEDYGVDGLPVRPVLARLRAIELRQPAHGRLRVHDGRPHRSRRRHVHGDGQPLRADGRRPRRTSSH